MALINFSGIASGIDSSALIESLLNQQRTARVKPLEAKITAYQDTNSSFGELKTLLDKLSTAASAFRTLNGGVLSKQATSSDETVATAVANNGAANGTYDVTVAQTAKNATFSFDDRFGSQTAVVNSSINDGAAEADRTVSFTIGSGAEAESVDVVLTSTTTASDFVTQFNSSSETATASLVNVGTSASPSYAIVINSNTEGTDEGLITLDSVGAELAAGGGALQTNTLSQAEDAEFTLSGVSGTITRSSNSLADVISGVTLTLQDVGSATVTVTDNPDQTVSTIQDFVDAFNDVVEYIKENDLVRQEEDGGELTNIFGPLATTSIDENLISGLREALTQAGISGATINTLAEIGITTERDGTLAFDSDTAEDAISSDSESVRTIFANLGEDLAAVDGRIAQFTRFNGIIDSATNANTQLITDYQRRISDIESSLDKQEQALTNQFARLEAIIGNLQSQQNALSSLLPS